MRGCTSDPTPAMATPSLRCACLSVLTVTGRGGAAPTGPRPPHWTRGFCSGTRRFLSLMGTHQALGCLTTWGPPPARAEVGLRPLTGSPAFPGWPCGREGQRHGRRQMPAAAEPPANHAPDRTARTLTPWERATARCQHGGRNPEPRRERKATFTAQIPLSLSHRHKTQEHQKLHVGQNLSFHRLSGFCLKAPWARSEAALGSPPPVLSMTLRPGDQGSASHARHGE